MAKTDIRRCIEAISDHAPKAFDAIETDLPKGFPSAIHDAVKANALQALNSLAHQASE